MKNLTKTITAALVISGILGLSSCSKDISAVSTTSKQEEKLAEVNTNTENTAASQISETEISNVLTNESKDIESLPGSISNDYMVDGVFQLTKIMNDNSFYDINGNGKARSELGGYGCSFEGLKCHISITTMSGGNTVIIQIFDDDFNAVYQTTFSQEGLEFINTDYENIILRSDVIDVLYILMPKLKDAMDNNLCPFAGLNIKHGMIDNNNNKSITDHND